MNTVFYVNIILNISSKLFASPKTTILEQKNHRLTTFSNKIFTLFTRIKTVNFDIKIGSGVHYLSGF